MTTTWVEGKLLSAAPTHLVITDTTSSTGWRTLDPPRAGDAP